MENTLQSSRQDNPAKSARYTCAACGQKIGDSAYTVSFCGIVRHRDCLRHALDLIKREIIPIDHDQSIVSERNHNLHVAVQIIVTVARKNRLLHGRSLNATWSGARRKMRRDAKAPGGYGSRECDEARTVTIIT